MITTAKILNLILPAFDIIVLILTYYEYVIKICLTNQFTPKTYTYLGIYHFLLFMSIFCFIKVISAAIATVPVQFSVPPEVLQKVYDQESNEIKHRILLRYCEAKQLPVVTRTITGFIRYCDICKQIKPDRAHHCSSCRTCVLRMDHHCPWVNNCICLTNNKSFILLLFYLSSYTLFCCLTSIEYVLNIWDKDPKAFRDIQTLAFFCGCIVIGLVLVLLFTLHITLLVTNTTTLEQMSKPTFYDSNEEVSFNVGFCKNIKQIFGNSYICFFCPVETTTCDGINYPLSYSCKT